MKETDVVDATLLLSYSLSQNQATYLGSLGHALLKLLTQILVDPDVQQWLLYLKEVFAA